MKFYYKRNSRILCLESFFHSTSWVWIDHFGEPEGPFVDETLGRCQSKAEVFVVEFVAFEFAQG